MSYRSKKSVEMIFTLVLSFTTSMMKSNFSPTSNLSEIVISLALNHQYIYCCLLGNHYL